MSRRPVQNNYVCKLWYTEGKELSHFDIKSWVTCGTKIRPGKVGNWRIFESNWLNIKSQIYSTLRVYLTLTLRVKLTHHWESNWLIIESPIDSNILQLFTLPGRITISPVTQLLRSKWLIFSLGALREKNWDHISKVKMTQFFFLGALGEKIESFWSKKLSRLSWVKNI